MHTDPTIKARLLTELSQNTWVQLAPSPVHGIGVFAIRDIPPGCRTLFAAPGQFQEEWVEVSKEEMQGLPTHAQALIENYCLFDEEHYYVPQHGFKKIDLLVFLNHSVTPNVQSIDDGEYFETLRWVKKGEELLIDYGMIVDSDE